MANLSSYPENFLEFQLDLATWYRFALEWKERVTWLAPILLEVAAGV